MYLRRLTIKNIRSIEYFEMSFEKGAEAGWHVILGQNGSGKSSFVRALALILMGERDAFAADQIFSEWLHVDRDQANISATIVMDEDCDKLSGQGPPMKRPINLEVVLSRTSEAALVDVLPKFSGERHARTVWGGGAGWFSASFGPFRRFTGGDPKHERAFLTNPRLAPHLSALTESVALREAQRWLTDLHVQTLQDQRGQAPDQRPRETQEIKTKEIVVEFVNNSGLLPHGTQVHEIRNNAVLLRDGNDCIVPMEQMSDGYRSILSLTLELLRQMFRIYGFEEMRRFMGAGPGVVNAPGVVAIDEVDAHLHPTWQRDIGRSLRRCFPKVQFLVTTHSPIVCRAVADDDGNIKGSVWLLPRPGAKEHWRQINSPELEKLVFGDILDAYETSLFGNNVVQSQIAEQKMQRLALLNFKAIRGDISPQEREEHQMLREMFPRGGSKMPNTGR